MTENIDVKELITDFNEYISKVGKGLLSISEDLRKNNIQEALYEISNFVEGMNWLISASNYMKANNIPVEFDEQKIIAFFEEINDSLTVQDYFLVADLFEYEIAEYFTGLKEVIINN